MKIQTFKNLKGIIHGADPKRIGCDKAGVLKVGAAEIPIHSEKDEIMPLLFNGCDGDYPATFTDADGRVYVLEKVAVRGGRIAPPSPHALEIMDLRCRLEETEAVCDSLKQKVHELGQIFDTNSLNFLLG